MFTLTNPGQSIEVTCEEQFRKADTDSGGSLSYKEFGALVDRVTGEKKLPKARGELLRVARKDKHDPLALAALQHLNSVCPERAGLHEGEPRRTAYEVDRETFRGVTKIEL